MKSSRKAKHAIAGAAAAVLGHNGAPILGGLGVGQQAFLRFSIAQEATADHAAMRRNAVDRARDVPDTRLGPKTRRAPRALSDSSAAEYAQFTEFAEFAETTQADSTDGNL